METVLPSYIIPLKGIIRTLTFLFSILIWGISFGQQDIAINTEANASSGKENSDTSDTQYMVLSTDQKVPEKYKDMEFKLHTSDSGTIYLEIKSEKKQAILLEIKSKMDDELLFRSIHLKKGNNIITCDSDDPATVIFLKLTKFNSNKSASFIVLRK